MNAPDPFDLLRAYTAGTEMRQQLDAAQAEIVRLKAEVERLQALLAAKEGRADA